jgi:hypothetical protein
LQTDQFGPDRFLGRYEAGILSDVLVDTEGTRSHHEHRDGRREPAASGAEQRASQLRVQVSSFFPIYTRRGALVRGASAKLSCQIALSEMNFGQFGLWLERFSIRGYEWVVYAWSAGVGALWGGLVNPFVIGVEPSNPLVWLVLWPGWLDLQLRSLVVSTAFWNPIVEPSVIGMVGACVVAYMLLTISHVRE